MDKNKQKKLWEQRKELSDEGKQMWDAMMEGDKDAAIVIAAVQSVQQKQTRRVKEIIVETDESQRMRLELRKMQQNSKVVVTECEELQKQFVKREEYFKANECRVAATIHSNFIERLQRILDGLTAFEGDINFPDVINSTDDTIFVR